MTLSILSIRIPVKEISIQNSIAKYVQNDDQTSTKNVACNIFNNIKWKSDVLSLLTKPIVFISLSIATVVVGAHIPLVGLPFLVGKVMMCIGGSAGFGFGIENTLNGALPMVSQAYRNQGKLASECILKLKDLTLESLKLKEFTLESLKLKEFTREDSGLQLKHYKTLLDLSKQKCYKESLGYQPLKEITNKGGIILIDCGTPDHFVGVALSKDDKDEYIFELCPGGGNSYFSKRDFDFMMPIVVQTLEKLGITPTALNQNIGRHPENTMPDFEQWLQDHVDALNQI